MTSPIRFIFQKNVENIFNVFTELFDIRIAFFSNSGEELNVGKDRMLCRYCKLLREELEFEEKCLKLDQEMRLKAERQKQTVVYQCHGGMTEAVTPIMLENELIGYVMIGQFRTSEKPLPMPVLSRWQKKFTNDEITKTYWQTPFYSPKYSKDILYLFSVLVDFIVSQRMIEMESSSSIGPLVKFLQNHVEENLSLDDASRIVCQSRSSISHKFKKITGKSFKQFQTELKLAKADEYLANNPEITVREVASKLGFEDPFYFSRLYKKHRGLSPKKTQKLIRQDQE